MAVASKFNTKELQKLCQKFKVKELYLFGSAASGNLTPDSDLDFIVNFDHDGYVGAFDQFIDFKQQLEKITDARSICIIRKSLETLFSSGKSTNPSSCFTSHKIQKLLQDISLCCIEISGFIEGKSFEEFAPSRAADFIQEFDRASCRQNGETNAIQRPTGRLTSERPAVVDQKKRFGEGKLT